MSRIFLKFFIFLTFTSCTSINTNNIAPGYVGAYQAIKGSIFGSENVLDLEYIKRIPYASMIVRIGNGPSGLMILESKSDDKLTWVSADGVYLVIRQGRIIQSQGLTNNLDEITGSIPSWDTKTVLAQEEFITYHSFGDPDFKNLKVISNYSTLATQIVDLKLNSLQLTMIEEKINASKVGWKTKNIYWLDEKGFVRKSSQNISPRLPEIHYIVTKKPR